MPGAKLTVPFLGDSGNFGMWGLTGGVPLKVIPGPRFLPMFHVEHEVTSPISFRDILPSFCHSNKG